MKSFDEQCPLCDGGWIHRPEYLTNEKQTYVCPNEEQCKLTYFMARKQLRKQLTDRWFIFWFQNYIGDVYRCTYNLNDDSIEENGHPGWHTSEIMMPYNITLERFQMIRTFG